MIDPRQLRAFVIDPVLNRIGLYSLAASDLVLGTIAQESACGQYIKQIGGGPALGICQMEPATHDDIWKNFLRYKDDLRDAVARESACGIGGDARELVGNLNYAVAMCRVHYARKPGLIPADRLGQARYWKQWYNTEKGAGSVDEYMRNWARYVEGRK